MASLLSYAAAVLLGRDGQGAEAAAAFAATDADMGALVAWYLQYAHRLAAEAALVDGWGEPVAWLREAAAFFAAFFFAGFFFFAAFMLSTRFG